MNDIYNIDKAIKHLSKNDKVMLTIIKKNGKCNLSHKKQYFSALVRAIVGQQLSVSSARAINGRLFDHFNKKPTAESIINTAEGKSVCCE